MNKKAALVFDVEGLERKLANPPPLLKKLYDRFAQRLVSDTEFRQHHIFLPALLGEAEAIAEAKQIILHFSADPHALAHKQSRSSKATSQQSLDSHIWCVAPRAMRLAVFFTWLDIHNAWTDAERELVGHRLLDFIHTYVVPVLRARVPAGHNQQFSMTFCSVVIGHVFSSLDAGALRDSVMPKFHQVLGLMPSSGYSGEGSTYQSDVVSPLVMWAGVFLTQLGESNIWRRSWPPNQSTLASVMKLEAAMGSCGGLLPPWDHYGWSKIHNLAARTLWANLSGEHELLNRSDSAWDEESSIAWRDDDRLWTLIYWPEVEKSVANLDDQLTCWSLPNVGAAIENRSKKFRIMSVWDRCSDGLQGLCRGQVNPNHLIMDFAGEPVTADGWERGEHRLFSNASWQRTLSSISLVEKNMLIKHFGSLDNWVKHNQHGFLGLSCGIIVDGWDSYFPRMGREGRLIFEKRTKDCYTFSGESAAYYQPAMDITRMRRTVSMGLSGLVWIVDEIRADSLHDFSWRIWLRGSAFLDGPRRLQLALGRGLNLTMSWADEGSVSLKTVEGFPENRPQTQGWPEQGSKCYDRILAGRNVVFVTCFFAGQIDNLEINQVEQNVWEAAGERFVLPDEVLNTPDDAPTLAQQGKDQHSLCDLEETPFALLNEPDDDLLAALENPTKDAWRRTGAAMQTLVMRKKTAALPKILTLLQDSDQHYTVHSVAAWCLGKSRYAPAREALTRLSKSPEDNTAARAKWAMEALVWEKTPGRVLAAGRSGNG